MVDYTNLYDEEIVILAQKGDDLAEEYLIKKYEKLTYCLSKRFYSQGVEHEDFLQMGLIGLFKAIKGYNCSQKQPPLTSFKSFASLCVKSELFDYLRFCTRYKHQILNNSIPFLSYSTNRNVEDKQNNNFADTILGDTKNDPQNLILTKEMLISVGCIIKNVLTRLEKEVLILWLDDYSYKEISLIIGKNVKSVENSIQRIRKKLKKEIIELSA